MRSQTTLEIGLAILSLAAHILDARQIIWSRVLAFPILCINIYVYALRNLYGKVAHSILGLFVNSYAYVQWKGSTSTPPIQVSKTSRKKMFYACLLTAFGTLVWSLVVSKRSHHPNLVVSCDACYFFMGLIEKWMMAHKKVERWVIALFRYTCLAIACYQAGSIILTVHQVLLMGCSVYGQLKWYKAYKNR